MNFFVFVFQDWARNSGNTKGRIVACAFRIANFANDKKLLRVLFLPYLVFYKFVFEWILGFELPFTVSIGPGLRIAHLQSVVINKRVSIGRNVKIRHCLTIGNKGDGGGVPLIGDNVNIGANVCIIGPIKIGDNVSIGAGSVVVKNVPSGAVVVGNPARIIN